jgi:hypothetical protein
VPEIAVIGNSNRPVRAPGARRTSGYPVFTNRTEQCHGPIAARPLSLWKRDDRGVCLAALAIIVLSIFYCIVYAIDGARWIMPHFWLTYGKAGRLIGVVIMEAPTLIEARMNAAVEGIIDAGAPFVEGHELAGDAAAGP